MSGAPQLQRSTHMSGLTCQVQRIAPRNSSAFVAEVMVCVGVTAAVVPCHIRVGTRIDRRFVRTNRAVDQKLQQVGAQHVPVVVVIFLAVVADHDEAANSPVGEQRLVDGEIGEILLDREPFALVQGDAGLHRIQHRSRITGVVGERVWWEARWEMITHISTVTDSTTCAPQRLHRSTTAPVHAGIGHPAALRCGRNKRASITR